jgi:hypothetical protein
MKYIITFSIATILSLGGIAQTGLTFSQCLTISSNDPWTPVSLGGNDATSPQIAVPDGKIWKIEYAYVYAAGIVYLNVNGVKASILNQGYHAFPIWLKSGDNFNFYGTFPQSYFISILEFNAN